jgi:hypothetical protein
MTTHDGNKAGHEQINTHTGGGDIIGGDKVLGE